jgi:hypothetical protein
MISPKNRNPLRAMARDEQGDHGRDREPDEHPAVNALQEARDALVRRGGVAARAEPYGLEILVVGHSSMLRL